MTYGVFLLLFVVAPLALSLLWHRRALRRGGLLPFALLLVVVYAATSPWDNYAVKWGLWDFGEGRTWGLRLGYLPLEEYLFFGLQSALVGVWARRRLADFLSAHPPRERAAAPAPARLESSR